MAPSFVALACLAAGPTQAEDVPCPRADYKYLRYDEDYSYLRRPDCSSEASDRIKFIPLAADATWFLSLGGEVRDAVEYFRDPTWGQDPQGGAYTLQRYMAHADLHRRNQCRFFVQLKSGLENGRDGGPRLFDEDRLDLHQAFADLTISGQLVGSLTLRMGRQEMAHGATRWISAREGVTVRQSFDGVKLFWASPSGRLDLFYTMQVGTKPGVFDDDTETGRKFWGAYASRLFTATRRSHLDVYYFGLERDLARFDQGRARETRHSVGARLWGTRGAWDYDLEPIGQWGSFGEDGIRAWAVETEAGYTLRSAWSAPRLGLRVDVASGDRDPADSHLETFNPMYPRGVYHQVVNLNGHVNLVDLQPLLTVHATERLTVTPDWDFIWRQSIHDGVYGVGGNLIRPSGDSRARYVGSQASLVTIYKLDRHITFVQIITRAFPGRFLQESGTARPTLFVSGWFAYKL